MPRHQAHVERNSGRTPLAHILLLLMRGWQLVPRIDPQRCRFHPTCSAYGITAVQRYGALRGGWLAIRRLGRCHPWNPGGVDHVPEIEAADRTTTRWRGRHQPLKVGR